MNQTSLILDEGDNNGSVYNENWEVKFLDNTCILQPDSLNKTGNIETPI